MKTRVLPVALILSAVLATPSAANWFHNPKLNINRNVGSAPSPTPEDIREGRIPIVVKNEDDTGPVVAALRWMFGGSRAAQAQPLPATRSAGPQTVTTTTASR